MVGSPRRDRRGAVLCRAGERRRDARCVRRLRPPGRPGGDPAVRPARAGQAGAPGGIRAVLRIPGLRRLPRPQRGRAPRPGRPVRHQVRDGELADAVGDPRGPARADGAQDGLPPDRDELPLAAAAARVRDRAAEDAAPDRSELLPGRAGEDPLRALDGHALRLHAAAAAGRGRARGPARRLRPAAAQRRGGLRGRRARRPGRAARDLLPPAGRRPLHGDRADPDERHRPGAGEGRRGGRVRPQVARAARQRHRAGAGRPGGALRGELQPHARRLVHAPPAGGRRGQGLPPAGRGDGDAPRHRRGDRRQRVGPGARRRQRRGRAERDGRDGATARCDQHEDRRRARRRDPDPRRRARLRAHARRATAGRAARRSSCPGRRSPRSRATPRS